MTVITFISKLKFHKCQDQVSHESRRKLRFQLSFGNGVDVYQINGARYCNNNK